MAPAGIIQPHGTDYFRTRLHPAQLYNARPRRSLSAITKLNLMSAPEPEVRRRPPGIYLLPNLLTTGALFSGFYAIVAAINGQFVPAVTAVFVAGLFDGLDGRVARMTNTQSEFGVQYDKSIKMGKHSLTLSYQGGDGEFKLRLILRVTEDNMIAICRQSDFQYSMRGGGGVLLDIPIILFKHEDSFFCIINWDGFEDLLLKLRQSPLRWSDAAQDIKGIDALFNGDIDSRVKNEVQRSVYAPYALIAAHLAGNPNFEELAISLGKYGKDSGKFWGGFNYAPESATISP